MKDEMEFSGILCPSNRRSSNPASKATTVASRRQALAMFPYCLEQRTLDLSIRKAYHKLGFQEEIRSTGR
jgi:hypothetical protein